MVKINIRGMIIKDNMKEAYNVAGIETTSVSDVLNKIVPGEDVEININSIGGDVMAGSEIFTALKSHDGKVKANIIFAASIATVIAMAAEETLMSPTGQFMIHNVSSAIEGDYKKAEQMAETLKNMNETIIAAYKTKVNIPVEQISAMMDKETWLSAEKAKEYGFIDGIMFEETKQLSYVACMTDSASNLKVEDNASVGNFVNKKDLEELKNELMTFFNSKQEEKQEPKTEPVKNKKLGLFL